MVPRIDAIYQNRFFFKPTIFAGAIFLILEATLKIDLQLSAFAPMFTYVLYCPETTKCPWLLKMIRQNISNCGVNVPACVGWLVLLHSPIIIDMNKFLSIHDPTSEEMIDFFL